MRWLIFLLLLLQFLPVVKCSSKRRDEFRFHAWNQKYLQWLDLGGLNVKQRKHNTWTSGKLFVTNSICEKSTFTVHCRCSVDLSWVWEMLTVITAVSCLTVMFSTATECLNRTRTRTSQIEHGQAIVCLNKPRVWISSVIFVGMHWAIMLMSLVMQCRSTDGQDVICLMDRCNYTLIPTSLFSLLFEKTKWIAPCIAKAQRFLAKLRNSNRPLSFWAGCAPILVARYSNIHYLALFQRGTRYQICLSLLISHRATESQK